MQIGYKMSQLLETLKQYKCTNCAHEYQSLSPYMHNGMLGLVCLECMDIDAPESVWA